MNTAEVYQYSRGEIADQLFDWSCGLWWSDFEEAGIETCYIAWVGDVAVGYQTVDIDGLCVAIEVREEFQSQGIGSQLVNESGCSTPRENECPEFWSNFD